MHYMVSLWTPPLWLLQLDDDVHGNKALVMAALVDLLRCTHFITRATL